MTQTLPFTIGQTIWFVEHAETDHRDVAENDIAVPFLYSAVVKSITEYSRVRRPEQIEGEPLWDEQHYITFEGDSDENSIGMTFWIGEGDWRNRTWYADRDTALAVIAASLASTVQESEENLRKAENDLVYVRDLATWPLIESTADKVMGYGFRLSTLRETIEQTNTA